MARILFGLLLLFGAAACGDATIEPLPLDIRVEASRATAAPGDTISFRVTAQGGTLVGVEMDFGDGADDSFGTSGARTAQVTFRHSYTSTGNFTVSAVLTDAFAGQKTTALGISVQ
jgi:PKD domain